MSKRKHRRKKQLSAEEKERRRQLAEERKERQKREKKRLFAEVIVITLVIIIFFAVMILSAIFNPDFLLIFFIVISALAILIFDESGIRSFLFRWYPDRLPFSEYLKSHDPNRSVPVQLASTTGWTMFMLMLFNQDNRIFAVIWLVCVVVGLYYMLTTDEYSLEKGAKYECSLMYLLLTPMYILLMTMYSIRITPAFIAFTVIFTVVYSIAYAVKVNNGNRHYSRIFFGIIISAMCASAGFLLINRTLDFSEPHEYRLTVEDKYRVGGKSTNYYIETQDWHNPDELIDIRVDYDIYPLLEKGDTVIIETHSGSLGVEYYEYRSRENEQDN